MTNVVCFECEQLKQENIALKERLTELEKERDEKEELIEVITGRDL